MKKLIFLSCFLFALNTCSENPVTDDTPKPGRRDYLWTVDTLDTPNNSFGKLWGSSPSDVWRTSDGDWDKSISHFDGETWTSYGISGIIVPFAIYGFSNTSVFIGGAGNGKIWRYDGSSWAQFAELRKDGHNDIWIEDIWGESPSDFYAFGAYPDENGYANKSVIAHNYNGSCEMLNTNELYGIVEHLYKDFSDNKIYLQIIGGQNFIDSTHIYEYVNGNYQKIYSNIWTQGLQADISFINNEVYFILGNKLVKRKNKQFDTIIQVDNPNFYQRIWGRNSKDIFLLMTNGLAHYNGNNIEYLFHFTLGDVMPWTQIYGAALFEKDVFFLVDEPPTGLSLVYHGVLK